MVVVLNHFLLFDVFLYLLLYFVSLYDRIKFESCGTINYLTITYNTVFMIIRFINRLLKRGIKSFMKDLLMMYVTLLPAIIAGVLNMIWCKSSVLRGIQTPIDCGKKLKDGKRIFGDNKTWKGMLGYIVFNILAAVVWGAVCNSAGLNDYDFFTKQTDYNRKIP